MLADLRDSEKKLQTLLRGMDQVDAKIDRLLNQPSQVLFFSILISVTNWFGLNRLAFGVLVIFVRFHCNNLKIADFLKLLLFHKKFYFYF